jgi:hypothetical protein
MDEQAIIADHWAKGDVYALIVSALERASKPLGTLTIEDLAPIDHFHARGFPATVELADRLPVQAGHHLALTEHGLGRGGKPHYPVPWSEDGSGSCLVPPEETRQLLAEAGFTDIVVEDTGPKYLAGYRPAMELAAQGALPPLGIHLLLGETAPQKTRNAARNIEEGRTRPVQIVCRKR